MGLADPWVSPNFGYYGCPQNPKGEGQFPVVIVGADEEPMLVDTGATYTCVSQQYATHLPMSNKFVETIGFSGTKQLIRMTAPVRLSTEGSEITIPIGVSCQTPLNFLGREALCKLKIKICCSPQGIFLDKEGLEVPELTHPDTARIYWLGDISEPVTVAFNKWEKYIRVQCPKAREPTLDYHCIMMFQKVESSKTQTEDKK